jgi:hypothetical protein
MGMSTLSMRGRLRRTIPANAVTRDVEDTPRHYYLIAL